MKNFPQIFRDVERLTATEDKPLSAMVSQLFQEGGELAEAASITEGHIRHKVLQEPLVGEVADVCQCAISILVRATPDMEPEKRLELFLSFFDKKNAKWGNVQANTRQTPEEAEEAELAPHTADVEQALDEIDGFSDRWERLPPAGSPHDIEERVLRVTSQQLGLAPGDALLISDLVNDLGADSLDLVELAMAIEDEFEMEISDADAEVLYTPRQIVAYVKKRFGIEDDPADAYTESTGRYLSLEERMQERSLKGK